MSNAVRFILDDQVKELDALDPTLTVLNYLRTVERKCGTKEGCAEGDCGACTVVVGERAGERVRYRAVNACILFTPTLDGKQLITVENLKRPDGSLHPVQRAMVECHGSQCGFCTPGFVMSLFALYKSETEPSLRRINDALAGNLCRCTGYRPIVDAARRMYADGVNDQFAAREAETVARLRAIERHAWMAGFVEHAQGGFDDRPVAGAAAQVAGERLVDLVAARQARPSGLVLVERPQGHHEARRAEAALRAVAIDHRLLDGVQRAIWLAQVFHGIEGAAVEGGQELDAGVDGLEGETAFAIEFADDDGAGAAVAFRAAFLGAAGTQILAQVL